MRTPQQIIGNDKYLQLVFEGYEVIPMRRKCQRCAGAGTVTMMPDGHEIECPECEGECTDQGRL